LHKQKETNNNGNDSFHFHLLSLARFALQRGGTTWKMERVEDLSINNLIIVFKTSKKTTGRQQHNQTMDGNARGFVNKEVA